MKRRRSLTHVGGAVETAGVGEVATALAQALEVSAAPEPSGKGDSATDDPDRGHVHGFHTYPARMHPTTASRLIQAVSGGGATLLDPFCGSGTVLVEAMIAGRRAMGVDLNPLAVRLARVKTSPGDPRSREEIVAAARDVAAFADERRERRAGATRRYAPEDVASFEPHVLLELDSLRVAIAQRASEDAYVREALELVLSSMLLKISRRASDTSEHVASRRIAAGYAARLFKRKAAELVRRLAEFSALLAPGTPRATVVLDDASRLRTVAASSVDAIVTSPPYASTYDYVAHHALRMRWLGLDARGLLAGEMGARRQYAGLDPGVAREKWTRDLATIFRAMSRVCRKGARVAVVLADSAAGDQALRADAIVAAVAPGTGFALLARASQTRPHFHGPTARAFRDAPRAEHAIVLEKG
jgi:16S rRNA G966 N2-methylase RsmD